MCDFSEKARSDDGAPASPSPRLTLVHSVRPAVLPVAVLPAALGQFGGAVNEGLRKGRPGRRLHALLIDGSLPRPGVESGPGPGPDPGPVLARALRRLSFEVAVAPVDGELDSDDDGLAQHGIACLGRPVHRSVEEVLGHHAGVFDLVCLLGAELARAYEPLVRLHDPAARVLCCLPGLAFPELARQAQFRPELTEGARAVQRREVLAAYGCDATLVPTEADAETLLASLPLLPVHVVPWSDPASIDTELHRAIGVHARSHRSAP